MGWKQLSRQRHHDDRPRHKLALRMQRAEDQASAMEIAMRLPARIVRGG